MTATDPTMDEQIAAVIRRFINPAAVHVDQTYVETPGEYEDHDGTWTRHGRSGYAVTLRFEIIPPEGDSPDAWLGALCPLLPFWTIRDLDKVLAGHDDPDDGWRFTPHGETGPDS